MSRRRWVAVALVVAALAGCGSDERELAGYTRDPAPQVDQVALPDLGNGGAPFELRADPGELLVVYFGYTNCPDFCPTTLSDAKLARARLDDPGRVELAMVTIDPERDLPVLAGYLGSFVEDGHALGTSDQDVLARASAPFGVTYAITRNDEGEIEVAHTTQLYAIDDTGSLVLTWPFGVSIEDIAADLAQLLERDPA